MMENIIPFSITDLAKVTNHRSGEIKFGEKMITIPKEENPMDITFDRAVEIILLKRESDANKIIKIFTEDDDYQLLNGRWGAYLKVGKNNFKLPKGTEAEKLTFEECKEIESSQAKPSRKSIGKAAPKAKVAPKKKTVSKAKAKPKAK
jgi:DNA topoisomerase-1